MVQGIRAHQPGNEFAYVSIVFCDAKFLVIERSERLSSRSRFRAVLTLY
jgi:hypothetical protein